MGDGMEQDRRKRERERTAGEEREDRLMDFLNGKFGNLEAKSNTIENKLGTIQVAVAAAAADAKDAKLGLERLERRELRLLRAQQRVLLCELLL